MKSFVRVFAAATLFVLFITITIQANDKHDKRASHPASVVSARTVYVDNQATTAELQNTAHTELSKWGRLQIVDTPQKADIVLRLSNGNYLKFVTGEENPPTSKPKTFNEKFAGADEAVPPGSTRISVIDPKTGNSLWSDIRKTDNAKAATHMLDGLREAFDQKHK
jgi:hypothetical protein